MWGCINMECSVCFEPTDSVITCPCCMDASICKTCAKTYVLMIDPGNVHGCMVCKKTWSDTFIEDMFGNEVFIQHIGLIKKQLFDREKALISITQPLANYQKYKNLILQENKNLAKIKNDLLKQAYDIEMQIHNNLENLREAEPLFNVKYVLTCPSSSCKGFVCKDTWTCTICESIVCARCHIIKKNSNMASHKNRHRCHRQDIETARTIMKETKPCPACAYRIQKISGCSQMFCTNCMTAFDWESLDIVTGNIHNPHYYDFIKNGIIRPRAVGDIPCGGVPDFIMLDRCIKETKDMLLITKMYIYYSTIMDLEGYLQDMIRLKTPNELLTDIRIKYILGDYRTDIEYSDDIFSIEMYNKKCQAEKNILDCLMAIISERFRDIIETYDEIMKKRDAMTDKLLPIRTRRHRYALHVGLIFNEIEEIVNVSNKWLKDVGCRQIILLRDGYMDMTYRGLRYEDPFGRKSELHGV